MRSLHTERRNIAARLPAPETTTVSAGGGGQPASSGQAVPAGTAQAPPTPSARPGAAAVTASDITPTETGAAQPSTASAPTPQGASVTTDPAPQRAALQEELGRDQALKRAVEAVYLGTPADQPFPTTQAPAGKPQDPQAEHGVLLRAAGVASAEIVAHHHTWEWPAARTADHDHFPTPPAVDDLPDGRITTTVLSRSLIALLIVLAGRYAVTRTSSCWSSAGVRSSTPE